MLMLHRRTILLLPLLAGALTGCRGDETPADTETASTTDTTSATTDPTGGPQAGPTYWQDIAPIFFADCVTCHRDGGIGPFVLDDYAEAKKWAEASASAVEARTMPPWLVTDDGTCGTFKGSRALSQAEIELVRAWVDAGAPEGTPRDDLAPPPPETLTDAVDYKTPAFAPEPQGGDLATYDEYRCFRVETGLTKDRFITGYDVLPGNPKMIHHLLGVAVDPEETGMGGKTNAEIIAELDAQSPDRLGWPCFGAAGDGVNPKGIPITWAPGMGVTELPEGVGYRMKPTDWMIVQVHYNMPEPELIGQTDQTTMRVRWADEVAREGFFDLPDPLLGSLLEGDPVELEPGKPSVKYTWEYDFSYLPFFGVQAADLYGIFPHMHQRGRKMQVELIEGDAAPQCAADVQRWDFGWQLYYFYEQPFPLTTKSKLRVTCDFNTEGLTEPVLPGWGTENEMCLAGIFVVPK
mgnify:CR=1 FL=1